MLAVQVADLNICSIFLNSDSLSTKYHSSSNWTESWQQNIKPTSDLALRMWQKISKYKSLSPLITISGDWATIWQWTEATVKSICGFAYLEHSLIWLKYTKFKRGYKFNITWQNQWVFNWYGVIMWADFIGMRKDLKKTAGCSILEN